jgi:hypothetical protein
LGSDQAEVPPGAKPDPRTEDHIIEFQFPGQIFRSELAAITLSPNQEEMMASSNRLRAQTPLNPEEGQSGARDSR